MPKAVGEIIGDMTTASGGKVLVSARTARERIPGVDPDQEVKRIQEETAQESQQSLDGGFGSAPQDPFGGYSESEPTPPPIPSVFPGTWIVNKDIIRDSTGRISSVVETVTPSTNGNGSQQIDDESLDLKNRRK